MRIIQLTQGATAVVDDADFDRLSGYRYKLLRDGDRRYAYREEDDSLTGLHQDVLGVKPGVLIDHRDGNGLNCIRSNLRYATQSQNQANRTRPKPSTASSSFKGVTMLPARWLARIKVDGRSVYLGTFDTEEAAARAYDEAAKTHFREFAALNFPAAPASI